MSYPSVSIIYMDYVLITLSNGLILCGFFSRNSFSVKARVS